jgi:hypothetical protein
MVMMGLGTAVEGLSFVFEILRPVPEDSRPDVEGAMTVLEVDFIPRCFSRFPLLFRVDIIEPL